MPVPDADIVCRFVRPKEWHKAEGRPRAGAFKQQNLSVWHVSRLQEHGVDIEVLRLDSLAGAGQAHHTAGDYRQLAAAAAEAADAPLSIQVEWRPEDEFVHELWRQWRYAHVQVEALTEQADVLPEYRRLLAISARTLVPPDGL